MIYSRELKERLKEIVISNNLWFTDSKYRTIDSLQLTEIIKDVDVSKSPYIRNVHECEEFALSFLAEFRNFEAKEFISGNKNFSMNSPVGICAGVKFNGIIESHTKIIALCTDGIFLIEPQSNTVKEFNKNEDDIFFVYM